MVWPANQRDHVAMDSERFALGVLSPKLPPALQLALQWAYELHLDDTYNGSLTGTPWNHVTGHVGYPEGWTVYAGYGPLDLTVWMPMDGTDGRSYPRICGSSHSMVAVHYQSRNLRIVGNHRTVAYDDDATGDAECHLRCLISESLLSQRRTSQRSNRIVRALRRRFQWAFCLGGFSCCCPLWLF